MKMVKSIQNSSLSIEIKLTPSERIPRSSPSKFRLATLLLEDIRCGGVAGTSDCAPRLGLPGPRCLVAGVALVGFLGSWFGSGGWGTAA